jgi:TusA-related sulfurtransferase
VRARAAVAQLAPGETLLVLATDPEAPLDLAAFAADAGHGCSVVAEGGEWRIALTVGGASPAAG